MRILCLFLLCAFNAGQAIGAAVSFTNDIAPIFAKKCIACQGERRAKGKFQLHTYKALTKGKKGDAVIAAGKPDESELFKVLISKDEDNRMPQNDDPLPAAQIALIKQWIQEGAKFDGPDKEASIKTMVAATNFPDPPTAYPHEIPVLALGPVRTERERLSRGADLERCGCAAGS